MKLPTAKEINVHGSLDERHACEVFLRKNIDEAEALFRENWGYYQEDWMWMGPFAFRFYAAAAIRFTRSDAAKGNPSVPSCLASVLEFWLEFYRSELLPIAGELAPACGYAAEHYPAFDVNPEIFGDVRSRLLTLQAALERLVAGETND